MPNTVKIQIAEPCHENWHKMTANEQGRFCQSCQKTVTDFSLMDDKEILQIISRKHTDICGRFTNDQINRPLITDHRSKAKWAYFWNILIASVIGTGVANAQACPPPRREATATAPEKAANETKGEIVVPLTIGKTQFIEGVVIDSKTNKPVPRASVYVSGTENGIAADSSGRFKLRVLFGKGPLKIKVTAIGYEESDYTVESASNSINFFLEPSVEVLPELVVSAPSLNCTLTTTGLTQVVVLGGISPGIDISLSERTKRSAAEWIPEFLKKKEVKIYPNPVSPGSNVNITLHVPVTGIHTMEIIDTEGKILYREYVNVGSKDQTASISTSSKWSRGVYWVRVTSNDTRKVYNSKLVMQ